MHEGQTIGVRAQKTSLIILRIWNQTNLQCQLKAICLYKLGSKTTIDQFQCYKKKNHNGENINKFELLFALAKFLSLLVHT